MKSLSNVAIRPIESRPLVIYKVRDGRMFDYLAKYGVDEYDQIEPEEVQYWRKRGVAVEESK